MSLARKLYRWRVPVVAPRSGVVAVAREAVVTASTVDWAEVVDGPA